MSLINPAILWGLSLVSIPIILHFLMRSRPKKFLFPALRLVRARRQNTMRRIRVKQLWLLLLRMAVLALLVAAIARPTLPAANYNPSASETLWTAAIVAFAIAGYFWFARSWKRQRLPNHVYTYRRTLLRAGTGLMAFVLFLLAVLLPYGHRIAGEISSPVPASASNLPVAAVFLFDSSLSMSYRQRNLSRLEQAQNIAAAHLGRLPVGSHVAVTDTSNDSPLVFQAEQMGALERIKKLQPKPISLPLADRIRAALILQDDDLKRTLAKQASVPEDRYLREIYLFTDLTASSWHAGDFPALKRELERSATVQLYVIDVGVEKATNAAIIGPRLSSQTIAKGGDLTVEATVDVVGFENEAEWNLELHVRDEKGQLVKREKRTLKPIPGKPAAASFVVDGLPGPISQGELRLASSDPYSVDDVRYFTIAVTPPVQILVVGEARDETSYLETALAPSEAVRRGRARYKVKSVSASTLAGIDFKGYDLVCLVNVASPSQSTWSALGDFVSAGGGLLVIAGNERIVPPSYNGDAAQAILPARLTANVKLPEPTTLDLHDFGHPIFRKFEFFDGHFGELAIAKVYRRWGAVPVAGAQTLAAYADPHASPAILTRGHGAGHVILLTTALDRKGWSDLLYGGWPTFVLVDQVAHYLSRRAEAVYNYEAGEEPTIPVPAEIPLKSYLLGKPRLEQIPGEIAANGRGIVVRNADQLGSYTLVSRDEKVPFTSGFSVNSPASESDFTREPIAELDGLLGQGRFSVARSIEGLTRNVAVGRVGQEVFSLILGIVIAVFCAEHFVANRFYESEQGPEHQ